MSVAAASPPETILRLCAAAAPDPWYPRLYAREKGVDLDSLAYFLEELWLDGLIEKSAGTAETGPGMSLTALGQRVLQDPEALERLRDGRPVVPGDRGAVIRQALRAPFRPYVTLLLVLLNLLVFGYGYHVARRIGVENQFLSGTQTPQISKILEQSGLVAGGHLIEGQWWRLLTAGFVHIGLAHLLMNMVGLYLVGRYVEQMWGRLRYLLIYLVAGVGGTALGVAYNPGGCAGASSALCGLLSAEAMWIFLNRKYLARGLLRRARVAIVINLVLLVFISSFPGVSGWGHFGGAAVGLVAALLMHVQRFGPTGWRWLALGGLAPLLGVAIYCIDQARVTDKRWRDPEKRLLRTRYLPLSYEVMNRADEVYDKEVKRLLEMHPTRRPAAKLETVLSIVAEQQGALTALVQRLTEAGPYHDENAEAARQFARNCAVERAELFALAGRMLRQGEGRTSKNWQALEQKEKRVPPLPKAWKRTEE